MAIDKYGDNSWKDINKTSAAERMRVEQEVQNKQQVKTEKLQNNSFIKGMVQDAAKTAGRAKVDIELPKDAVKPQDVNKGKEGQKAEAEDRAKTKAEDAYQQARGSSEALNKTIYKTPEAASSGKTHVAEEAAKETAKKQGAESQPQAGKANPRAAEQAAARVAVPQTKKASNEKSTQLDGKPADKSNVGEKVEVEAKAKVEEGDKAETAAGKEVKGKPAEQAATNAGIAGGVTQQAKAEGKKEGESLKKESAARGKGKKVGKTGSVQIGPSETQSTAAKLKGLLGGEGDSPFDLDANETVDEIDAKKYEPVEWNTGVQTYTAIPELAKSEDVRAAFVEHLQRTVKPRIDKVNYENWDINKEEKFVFDTSLALELAQEYIHQFKESARLPKDPRNYGTRC